MIQLQFYVGNIVCGQLQFWCGLGWPRLFLGGRCHLVFAQGFGMNSFRLEVDEFHWSDQCFAIQVGNVEAGFSSGSSAACVAKCLLGRRCPSKAEGAGIRHLSLSCFWASLVYCASRLSWAGGMPDNIGRLLTGVAVSVPQWLHSNFTIRFENYA